jgi:uncharacterized Tic20 family protein
MALCASCQVEVATGKFCPTCGKQLVDNSAPVESQVSPPILTQRNNLAMWSHLWPVIGAVIGCFTIFPWFVLWLPGLLIRGSATATDFDRRHATESLNFQLSLLVYSAAATVLVVLTIGLGILLIGPALIGLAIAALVFSIMAMNAATSGREYRYPLSIRFVK